MELRRKLYDWLLNWKKTKEHECLLIKGARQIGKTYIVEKFGHEQYESFFEINFILDPSAVELFDGSLKADDLYAKISAYDGTKRLIPGKTLIFLDEIQECANARTALKAFAIDGKYDVIASGSLLGIKYKNKKEREKREPRSIPVGYERQVVMYSLSFEEFLWAKGVLPETVELLRGYFTRREIVPEPINAKFTMLLREYLLVGGMPAVVKKFIKSGDFGPVQDEQDKILAAYIDDIHKYADKTDVPKIENCYRAIPRLLAKDNRKFKFSEVEKGGSERKFGESVEWLKDSALAPMAVNVTVPEIPLVSYIREGWFKLYISDIGLLLSMYGLETKKQIFSGKLTGSAKGGIYENLIAGMLQRNGYPLFYFKTLDGTREVEFIIEKDGSPIPLEVKAHNGPTISLNDVLATGHVPYGYKFVDGNVGVTGKKITLPHYMAMFL